MANISSDESCTAPDRFHLTSSNDDDSASRLSIYNKKCLLCLKSRKNYHCRDCIRNGDFLHSNLQHIRFSETFLEKQIKHVNKKSRNESINEKINQYLQKKKIIENLKTTIIQKKEKIRILNNLLIETQNNLQKDNEKKKQLTNFNRTLRIKLPKYEDKVKELENYVITKLDDIEKRHESFNKYEIELKLLIRESIQKLVKYIFPIKKVIGKIDSQASCEITDLERDLADATRNISSRERYGFIHDSQTDVYHIIVAPFLPGSGDYSAYSEWVSTHKDGVPTPATATNIDIISKPNPAVRISAALTYTAQLVQVLSFYLDIRLPFKTIYSEFCSSMMTEQQITRRVARLNANILYLCYTQHVKLNQIHPVQTIENILKLFNTENNDLGRIGPVDPNDCNIAKNLEKQLIDELEFGDESDSEDDNNFPNEWEDISHNILSTSQNENFLNLNQSPNLLHQQLQLQQQQNNPATASMAGGLMTSAAASIVSIWKGWTTGR